MVQTRPPKAITTEHGQSRIPVAFSFIRTLTVGSGLSPDLLTPFIRKAARGLAGFAHIPPVGNFTPP
jgi:hypothetical protein